MSQLVKPTGDLLIPQDMLATAKYADDKVFSDMSGSGFLPRLQLNNAMSKLVTKGKAQNGTYVLVQGKDNILGDYSDEVSCLVLGWRPKAIHFKPDGSGTAFFNPKTKAFQEVEKEADKKPRPKGFLYGPEYLVYMPDKKTVASFHFNNPTMRNRAGEVKTLIGRAATFRTELIEAKGNEWYGPVVSGCSTPLGLPDVTTDEGKELHTYLREQIEKFCNPPDEAVEEVPDEEPVAGATGTAERPR